VSAPARHRQAQKAGRRRRALPPRHESAVTAGRGEVSCGAGTGEAWFHPPPGARCQLPSCLRDGGEVWLRVAKGGEVRGWRACRHPPAWRPFRPLARCLRGGKVEGEQNRQRAQNAFRLPPTTEAPDDSVLHIAPSSPLRNEIAADVWRLGIRLHRWCRSAEVYAAA